MPNGNYLTDEDVAIIQAMIDRSLLTVQNSNGSSPQPDNPRLAPETYLAKLKPSVTIAAIDTAVDPPIVSSGVCEIYKINGDDEIVIHEWQEDPLKKKVYNISSGALEDEDALFLVTRDKFGRFYPIGVCADRNEVWKFKITGKPTGGSFNVDVTVKGSQETLTFDFDFTAAGFKTELITHTELTTDDIVTSGGSFPNGEITVEFIGDFANKRMFNGAVNIPVLNDSALTGGTSPAAWIEFPQPGHPGDGYT